MLIAILPLILAGAVGPAHRAMWCSRGTSERAAAERAIDGLDREIRSLSPGAPVEPIQQALAVLLRPPCFRLARSTMVPPGRSATSVRRWWEEGGESWLRASLDGPKTREGKIFIEVPPEARPSLWREERPNRHLPLPFLCSAADTPCGSETSTWFDNAERSFKEESGRARGQASDCVGEASDHRNQQSQESRTECAYKDPLTESLIASRIEASKCVRAARKKGPSAQLATLLTCVMQYRARFPTLPIGQLRAPRRGWLTIQGRRGHYDFCDDLRAYDLDSGSVYGASSCSSLVLQRGGWVDFARTDARRAVRTLCGQLEPAQLRELAWALLIAPAIKWLAPAEELEVPAGIALHLPQRSSRDPWVGGVWGGSDAQTSLDWALVESGVEQARGVLTWPHSWDHGDNYADHVLDLAEKNIKEGCPSANLPPDLLEVSSPPWQASHLDATPQQLDAVQAALRDALPLACRRACSP